MILANIPRQIQGSLTFGEEVVFDLYWNRVQHYACIWIQHASKELFWLDNIFKRPKISWTIEPEQLKKKNNSNKNQNNYVCLAWNRTQSSSDFVKLKHCFNIQMPSFRLKGPEEQKRCAYCFIASGPEGAKWKTGGSSGSLHILSMFPARHHPRFGRRSELDLQGQQMWIVGEGVKKVPWAPTLYMVMLARFKEDPTTSSGRRDPPQGGGWVCEPQQQLLGSWEIKEHGLWPQRGWV